VAIRVKDLRRTLDFYVEKLGFPEMFRLEREGRLWMSLSGSLTGSSWKCFRTRRASGQPPRQANGLNYVCVEVDDMNEALVVLLLSRAGREKRSAPRF
jgi:lactoylglutathione lyase